jgi:TIR domain
MSGQIFISYRREESRWLAGRLYDRLRRNFSRKQIFIDIDAIPYGEDFANVIESKVARSDVVIAVIGNNWLTSKDQNGNRRLDNPEDFVRLEVGGALKRGIRVIPVLVDGASMPNGTDLPDDLKPLVRRNALRVTDTSFDVDCQRLVTAIRRGRKLPLQVVILTVVASILIVGSIWFTVAKFSNRDRGLQGATSVPHVTGQARTPEESAVGTPAQGWRKARGSVDVLPSPGEYISGGKEARFSTPTYQIMVDDSKPGQLDIRTNESSGWEIGLATADGKSFRVGKYDGAQRREFAEPGHPGLSITGPGRGCNEVKGSFDVLQVSYNSAGRLDRFAARLKQFCDDNQNPLEVKINLDLTPEN